MDSKWTLGCDNRQLPDCKVILLLLAWTSTARCRVESPESCIKIDCDFGASCLESGRLESTARLQKSLLYTRKNAMGTLKMFTIAFGMQTRGGHTFHIQKWCDLHWRCQMLLKMPTDEKDLYESVDQLKELILENRRVIICNVAHIPRISFGSDQIFWKRISLLQNSCPAFSVRSRRRITSAHARVFKRGLKQTQNSFRRWSQVMRCGFMGITKKPSKICLSGQAHLRHVHRRWQVCWNVKSTLMSFSVFAGLCICFERANPKLTVHTGIYGISTMTMHLLSLLCL